MRQARIRGERRCYYQYLSRVVDRPFVLHVEEKKYFVALMRKLEAFHGMRVLTYCEMDNHFHLLVKEPDRGSVEAFMPVQSIQHRFSDLKGQVVGSLDLEGQVVGSFVGVPTVPPTSRRRLDKNEIFRWDHSDMRLLHRLFSPHPLRPGPMPGEEALRSKDQFPNSS